LFSKPAHFVTSVLGDVEGLMNTYEENKRLKARLGEYASNKAELVEVQSENERLRQLVEKQDSLREYDPIPATVISRNPDQWEERIIIAKLFVVDGKQRVSRISDDRWEADFRVD